MSDLHTTLSLRGQSLAQNPARVDFEIFMEASQNLYCPIENPNGAFPLNVAENNLTTTLIKNKLTAIVQQNEMPNWVLNYTDLLGQVAVRTELARFMERFLCKCPISADTIALSAGATAIIEVSSFILANAGDVVVIPAPSYPMYTNDLGLKSGIERYDLQSHYHIEEIGAEAPIQVKHLDKAWKDLTAQGKCFKILLITSPDNPTGCRYTADQLREFANWCIQHKVHLIVNEIYGLSLIDIEDTLLQNDYKETGAYVSFATIMQELQSDYLHFWYAMSKDFAMSGLRFGIAHSLNKDFIKGFENANVPHLVSNFTQWMIAEMLNDTDFIENYIKQNKVCITESYKRVITTLKEIDVPYVPSRGSLFVWADFSKYLKDNSEQGEEQLWLDIYKNTGVLLTPGIGFQHQKKGLFRIVHTAVALEHLTVAMNRLQVYLLSRPLF